MKKSEIFEVILDEVCRECEIRRDLVLEGSKLTAVVEARTLAVQYMRRAGLSDDDIALIILRLQAGDMNFCPPLAEIKKKAKGISKVFYAYQDRCLQSYAFCLMSSHINKRLRELYTEHYCPGMKALPNTN